MNQKEFPTLYAKNKNGNWKEWKIMVEKKDENSYPTIHTQHGQYEGKMIIDSITITKEKRGYRDLWEQAIATAQSKWNHKHERENYQTSRKEENIMPTIYPMLAKTFDHGKHLIFPLYIQPKIDGIRCLARWKEGQVFLYSRTGCPFFGLDKIRNDLMIFLKNNQDIVVDGELYSDKMSFEELSGYCRRKKTIPSDQKVIYHVFDVVLPQKSFQKRLTFFPPIRETIYQVPTEEVDNLEQVKENLMYWIQNGYEGIILRNKDGFYEEGHRSWNLQKYKLFQEEEFMITGYTEGTGRELGLVIWQCVTTDGKVFSVRPKGGYDTREKLFQEAEKYIGKKLTVIFQEYTKENIPRFPVAKAIREEY